MYKNEQTDGKTDRQKTHLEIPTLSAGIWSMLVPQTQRICITLMRRVSP